MLTSNSLWSMIKVFTALLIITGRKKVKYILICSLKFANTETLSHSNNVFLNWVKIAKAFTLEETDKLHTSYTVCVCSWYLLFSNNVLCI